jgi:uncharacterized protein with HEPN domain
MRSLSSEISRRLRDILANIDRIHRHLTGMDEQQFLTDEKTRDAVERCLERIAEAARRIGDVLDKRYPAIEFPKLRRFGSVLRHDYGAIDADIVWLAVTDRLGPLEKACRQELERLGDA